MGLGGVFWGDSGKQTDRVTLFPLKFAPSAAVQRFTVPQFQNNAAKSCHQNERENNVPF